MQISGDRLLDSLFDGVYFVDVNRKITFWNTGAERISGHRKDEVIGSCCADNLLRHIDENGRQLCLDGCPLAATIADGKQLHCCGRTDTECDRFDRRYHCTGR